MAELLMRMDDYSFLKAFQTSECYKNRFSRENIFSIFDYIESEDNEDEYIIFCLVDIAERFRQDTVEDFIKFKINEVDLKDLLDIFDIEYSDNLEKIIMGLDYDVLVEKIKCFSDVINIDNKGNVLYLNY